MQGGKTRNPLISAKQSGAKFLIFPKSIDMGLCIFCLTEQELTEEHIVPASIGGSLKPMLLCSTCNSTDPPSSERRCVLGTPNQWHPPAQ